MTAIVSWNIQFGLGMDGRTDLKRIVDIIRRMGDFDVLCVQEIAINFAEMGGGGDVDQEAQMVALLPGYQAFGGWPVDVQGPDGKRLKFGNMIFSRLPVLNAGTHSLPRPADGAHHHMPRNASAVLVETKAGPLRVITTHLEFHSQPQRLAQAKRLRELYAEAVGNDRSPPVPGPGPYLARPKSIGTIICGDFNFETTGASYAAITEPFADGSEPLCDAWARKYPGRPHDPTCGIYDRKQWPKGANTRDFMVVAEGLVQRVESLVVDTKTDASDHQPLRLVLRD